jgi:hypothetical protein
MDTLHLPLSCFLWYIDKEETGRKGDFSLPEKQKREWRAKASDYKAYSLVLFAVSTFLYLGTIIPHALDAAKKPLVLLAIGILLAGAVYFAHQAATYARKIEEES